jgi:hypothetical protein
VVIFLLLFVANKESRKDDVIHKRAAAAAYLLRIFTLRTASALAHDRLTLGRESNLFLFAINKASDAGKIHACEIWSRRSSGGGVF